MTFPHAGPGTAPVVGPNCDLGYTIPAGQVYVAKDLVGADYYDAPTFDALGYLPLFTGSTSFYEISFNHRLAFVNADDVEVVH